MKKLIFVFLSIVAVLISYPCYAETINISDRYDLMASKLENFEGLLEKCKSEGINTAYEKIDYTIISEFIEYGLEDLEAGNASRSEYVIDALEDMYDSSYKRLEAYLGGTDAPLEAPEYKSGEKIYIDGESVKVNADTEQERSIFLNGFVGYDDLVKDMEILNDIGINSISVEFGMNRLIVNPKTSFYGGWRINYYGGINSDNIEFAREEGIGSRSSVGLRVTNNNETEAHKYVILSQEVLVEPYTEYEISISSRNISGNGLDVYVDGWDSKKFSIKNTSSYLGSKTVNFSTDDKDKISLWIISDSIGENIIDDITVRKIGTIENKVINGDFETELPIKSGMGVDIAALEEIKRTLINAQENEIAVNLLISLHYFPAFIAEEDDSYYRESGSSFGGGGIEWYKERIKEAVNLYIDTLVSEIYEYDSLFALCLTNEPMFNLMYSEESFARAYWTDYLKRKYSDISDLNKSWGSFYWSFDSVKIPNGIVASALAYEWDQMNEELFAQWHSDMAERVKNIAPDLLVHSKIINYLSSNDTSYERNFIVAGPEARRFSEFSDVHGNDAHGYLEENHTYQLQNKLMWYDYLTTIDSKTIFNSEDHIIQDGSTLYTKEQAKHIGTDLWQGAIHGRGISHAWVYGRSQVTGDTSDSIADSILHRPDVMSVFGKTSLDLNRLSNEIDELQNKEAEIAILYLPASRRYTNQYMNCLYQSYKAAMYSGHRVKVIDETALLEGYADDCRLLILPDTRYASDAVVEYVGKANKAGVNILALGKNVLKYDEYKKSRASDAVNSALEGAIKVNTSYDGTLLQSPSVDGIHKYVLNATENYVRILDGGSDITNTEWRCVEYEDGWLINLCSYDWENIKEPEIYINGNRVSDFYDVRNGKYISEVHLNGYEPVLLKIGSDRTVRNENPLSDISVKYTETGAYIYFNINSNEISGIEVINRNTDGAISIIANETSQDNQIFLNKNSFDKIIYLRAIYSDGSISKATRVNMSQQLTFDCKVNNGKVEFSGRSISKSSVNLVVYHTLPLLENIVYIDELTTDQNGVFGSEFGISEELRGDNEDFVFIVSSKEDNIEYKFNYIGKMKILLKQSEGSNIVVKNCAEDDVSASLICARYINGRFESCQIEKVDLEKSEQKELEISGLDKNTKIFVFDNMQKIEPIADYLQIK